MEPPEEDVRLSDEGCREESALEPSVLLDEVLSEAELSVDVELLVCVPLLAVVSASACIVPIRANTPAAAASVIAAVAAAVRRAPLRTAAAAPRSLVRKTVPLPSDAVSRPTVGERPEGKL
ncbi:hypothetical protein SAMN04487981_1315 [Streptomyces sp. cf386]|nr:hypothetical protein SAMN04487981_1315 [Streptomyces sp. cf386]